MLAHLLTSMSQMSMENQGGIPPPYKLHPTQQQPPVPRNPPETHVPPESKSTSDIPTFDAEPLPASASSSGLNEFITVTVFPCGRQDGSHLNTAGSNQKQMQRPYQLKIQKKMAETNLKDVFLRSKSMWHPIF